MKLEAFLSLFAAVMLAAASVLRADEVVWEKPALADVEVGEGVAIRE